MWGGGGGGEEGGGICKYKFLVQGDLDYHVAAIALKPTNKHPQTPEELVRSPVRRQELASYPGALKSGKVHFSLLNALGYETS